MTRAEILNCLTDRPCDVCKFHESGRCERWNCVFEEEPDDVEPCKVGCWIHTDECDEEWPYRCSICNMPSRSNAHRYCSNCGSYMYGIKPDDAEDCEDKRMTREEAIGIMKVIIHMLEEKYDTDRVEDAVDLAIEALSAEPSEALAREWCKQNDYVMMPEAVYEQDIIKAHFEGQNTEPYEDAISRHDAIHLADELKDDLPDDERMADMVTAHNEGILEYQTKLSLLPPVTPKQKVGRWIFDDKCKEHGHCSLCGYGSVDLMDGEPHDFCRRCGAKMVESEG